MPKVDINLVRTLRFIAATIAIVVAVSLPLGYGLIVYNFAAEATPNDAETHAELVTQRINAAPDLWRFETPRLDVIAATRLVSSDLPEKHYILDEHGAVLAQSAESLSPPILTRSAPLLDSGTEVGRFVTSRSVIPLLEDTALVALFGLVFALAIYVSLSVLPLRALTRILGSEMRFRTLTQMSSDFYWASDAKHRLTQRSTASNSSAVTVFRQPTQIGDRRWEIPSLSPDEAGWQVHRTVLDAHQPFRNFEFSRVGTDGTERHLSISGDPVFDESGAFKGYRGVGTDITERKEAEAKIVHLNRVYAMLSGINTLIVRVHDREELFREACRIAVEHGRFRMAWIGVVDRSAMKIVPVASASADAGYAGFLEEIRERISLQDGAPAGYGPPALAVREKQAVVVNDFEADPRIRHKSAHVDRGIRALVSLPLLIADEAVAVFSLHTAEAGFFDAEEMKLLTELVGNIAFAIDHIDKQSRLDYLAYYDELTGLANRRLFLERVAQYMRSAVSGGHKLVVFLIDLERFKNINDSLGRPAGDVLLKQVAEWLSLSAGDANMVARVGADHFATVLPVVVPGIDGPRSLEKTIAAFLAHPFRLNDAVLRIAAKVGMAVFPDDGTDAETLFTNAEAALKKAKASGERYVFYRQDMTEAVAGKLTLETQLRQALDKGEFVLHYQPKGSFASGKLTGAEALIRWNDPRTGLVPPGRFIPILEETGLIYEVGRWALHKAIADYLRWRAAGLPAVRIAVNVSPLQLRHRDFIDEIRQAIGIDANAAAGLELEITESLIMEDVKHNIASLQAIRALGVSIAIDDFGTGFSSLSYLAKLPVDTLKIDQSFVIDMTAGPEGLALVSTIINLAHSLKLKVVAEGVETEEQSRLLRLLACDEMQGFLFSKPVPADIFETRFLAPPAAG
jgi:diguanylate cyclase (GGDEF)-like protein/PAS domain S-box-containing protein